MDPWQPMNDGKGRTVVAHIHKFFQRHKSTSSCCTYPQLYKTKYKKWLMEDTQCGHARKNNPYLWTKAKLACKVAKPDQMQIPSFSPDLPAHSQRKDVEI
ncbi:hypothetical protein OPV22_024791 [Ensete ventricosum]|uniref:Uncharacterized protein n=1 Tax=Ensete ventricosum TaxID=4639 RepID=A0AAV8QBX2_ENSVE|nr:hypothetical protein OPV22_024791 [Ensete ventricosum]